MTGPSPGPYCPQCGAVGLLVWQRNLTEGWLKFCVACKWTNAVWRVGHV